MQISQRIGSAANPGGRVDGNRNSAVSARSPSEALGDQALSVAMEEFIRLLATRRPV